MLFLTSEDTERHKRAYNSFADIQDNPNLPPEVKNALAPGNTQVWYRREEVGSLNLPPPDPANLGATHTLLANVVSTDPEELYAALNFWSPYGEANRIVSALGIHTSMSVGDVLVIEGKVHVCEAQGFSIVE